MTIYRKEQPGSIQALFDSIAPRYDVGNSLMSFHLHALWNRQLAATLIEKSSPSHILDLCCGTGDIAIRMARYLKQSSKIHLVDFSEEMLALAKKRAVGPSFTFSQGDATALELPSCSFDAVSIAYGIRNIQEVGRCVQEVHRVLKPGGWLGILELTRPNNSALRALHALYLRTLVPLVGRWAVRNKAAYEYLSKSIHTFICPQELVAMLQKSGFSSVTQKPLTGGIATLIFAQKDRSI